MTAPACPRLFEVEALRDGRLAGAERVSFERHLANCPACAREADALDTLGQALRSSALVDVDQLQVRRERTRLLAAFDRSLVGPRRRSLSRGALVALSVAVLLFVGWLVPWRSDRSEIATASDTVIQGDPSARWSRHTQGDRERVVLEQGSLRIRVRQALGAPRLVVVLPDGELEDIGTTFSVTVTGRRTERVQVDEGSVLLKLRGRAPRTLRAGQGWQAPPASTPRPERAPDGSTEPSASAEPVQPAPWRDRAPTQPAKSGRPSVTSEALPPSHEASAAFRTALASFNAGESAGAALQFQRFGQAYPSDPRAEDAAYLRVLALERAGDAASRLAAARAYLRRYPTGFRREEVERLAH